MTKPTPTRQFIRRSIIFLGFLLFPIVQNYFSPYLIIDGAFQGILNGSALVFLGFFVTSLFFGRAWCGWLCPVGGMLESAIFIRDRKTSPRINWIKWLVWIPWMSIIVVGLITAGGIHQIKPLHNMDQIFALFDVRSYFMYYFVVFIIFALSLSIGNRAFCHVGCWMAPFMIAGRFIRNKLQLPALHLAVDPDKCTDCLTCTRNCPMSLDVNQMVRRADMENYECILCGNCVDSCSKGVIHYHV